jgi:hypothetical protein
VEDSPPIGERIPRAARPACLSTGLAAGIQQVIRSSTDRVSQETIARMTELFESGGAHVERVGPQG